MIHFRSSALRGNSAKVLNDTPEGEGCDPATKNTPEFVISNIVMTMCAFGLLAVFIQLALRNF